MDQISRIRCKNLLDRLLVYCDNAENDEERAVLLRISIVVLAKLRIYANVEDMMLSYDVRVLTKRVDRCLDRVDLLDLWFDTTDLVKSYQEAIC